MIPGPIGRNSGTTPQCLPRSERAWEKEWENFPEPALWPRGSLSSGSRLERFSGRGFSRVEIADRLADLHLGPLGDKNFESPVRFGKNFRCDLVCFDFEKGIAGGNRITIFSLPTSENSGSDGFSDGRNTDGEGGGSGAHFFFFLFRGFVTFAWTGERLKGFFWADSETTEPPKASCTS